MEDSMKRKLSKELKVTIKPVNVCDIYEVGNWTNYYPFLKLGYKNDDYQQKYSDITFYIKTKKDILGYCLLYNVVNIDEASRIEVYSRILALYDFAISARAYVRYGIQLMKYIINYAQKNGYSAIAIKKISKYQAFYYFLKRNFKLIEANDCCYIVIDYPRIKLSQKNLVLFNRDNVQIDDIYFLYDLHFSVGKTIINRTLNASEYIKVDRRSGIIKFPSNVKIMNDMIPLNSYTASIIYLVCDMYDRNDIKKMKIAYRIDDPHVFEVYIDDSLYVNKGIDDLLNNKEYVLNMMDKGIKYIYSYIIDYSITGHSFSYKASKLNLNDLIEKHFNNESSNRKLLKK